MTKRIEKTRDSVTAIAFEVESENYGLLSSPKLDSTIFKELRRTNGEIKQDNPNNSQKGTGLRA